MNEPYLASPQVQTSPSPDRTVKLVLLATICLRSPWGPKLTLSFWRKCWKDLYSFIDPDEISAEVELVSGVEGVIMTLRVNWSPPKVVASMAKNVPPASFSLHAMATLL